VADWIFKLLDTAGYAGLALLMWLENLIPPIPSELVMPLAGFKAANGELSFAGIVLAGTIGSMAGAYLFYGIAHWVGRDRVEAFCAKHGRWVAITPDDLQRASEWFEKHGGLTVFLCRLIPGLRSVISIPAGLVGQGLVQFSVYSVLGTASWCALLAFFGMQLGENYADLGRYLNPISFAIFGIALAWYLWRVLRPAMRRSSN
jgi:membrane protein DedA with SNARE-associated domain